MTKTEFHSFKKLQLDTKNLVSETRYLRNILLLNLTSEDLLSNLLVCPVWMAGETELRLDSLEHCMSQRPALSPAVTPLAGWPVLSRWNPNGFHAAEFRI